MISVIIPVYNVENYLEECLESVLKQTYKDYEVLMVDDGSTDISGKICDRYADYYDNFHTVHKKNEGLGPTRNVGVQHAKGEYIAFLDSDDYWAEDMLQRLVDCVMQCGVDMCKSGFVRVNGRHENIKCISYDERIYIDEEAKFDFLPRMIGSQPKMSDSVEVSVCACLYKKSIIDTFDIRFPSEKDLISEDLVFNINFMQHSKGAALLSYTGYFYRINQGSLTTKYRIDRFDACKRFYLYINDLLKEYGYDDITLVRLRRLLFVYLRMCISQEKRNVSGLDAKKRRSNIATICSDQIVVDAISTYPVRDLGIKQKIFLRLVQKRKAYVLDVLNEMKFI